MLWREGVPTVATRIQKGGLNSWVQPLSPDMAAGNDDYDYDEGRYLFFSTRCSREKNLLIPAAAGSFSLDAALGLLATRRCLGRRGNSFRHASSFCGVELYV